MPDLVTIDQYRRWTGDQLTEEDDLVDLLADAQSQVEEYLNRHLDLQERTETLKMFYKPPGNWQYLGYFVYPTAVPIQSVAVPAGGAVYGYLILGVTPPTTMADGLWSEDYAERVSVTYTGGFTSDTLPPTIGKAIARTARNNLTPTAGKMPAGAISVKNGDLAVAFNRTVGYVGLDVLDKGTRLALKPWRRVEL